MESALPTAASENAPGEPEGGTPDAPTRCESTFLLPAFRVEADTKVLRLGDVSAPRLSRVRWTVPSRSECGATQRRAWLVAESRGCAKDMRVLARPVQAHSPPAGG